MDNNKIEEAMSMLGERLAKDGAGPFRVVVCGGACLIACSLVFRTTKDVDIVALLEQSGDLASPDPLPPELLHAAKIVAEELGLPDDWLNNSPSRGDGGLFQVGLPAGLKDRLTRKDYGPNLSVYFISRLDQIHFKVFAATDSGPGRHVSDLENLYPTDDEIEQACKWAITHDTSEGFRAVLKSMLKQIGYPNVAERI